jgi:hypothetical protein
MGQLRTPGNSHRVSIIGRTGTGKSVAGLFLLSLKDHASFPWIIWNAKREPLVQKIAKIPGVEPITFKDSIPKRGLYILTGSPSDFKSDAAEHFLERVHARGRCGQFFDEGYTLDPRSDALNNIYTQGRSLLIPAITLSQRPAWLSPFSFSEAEFIQAFDLNRAEDKKRVEQFTPFDMSERLADYHSRWYDVGTNTSCVLSPVPPPEEILDNFDFSIRPRRKVI